MGRGYKTLALALLAGVFFIGIHGVNLWYDAVQTAKLESEPVTVVVDAGHGGEDGGATGIAGTRESDVNLQIALRARDLLAFAGVRTRMVREQDTAVYTGECRTISEKKSSDLKNRAKMVQETNHALLLSIHQNFFTQQKYSGAQVFYAGTDGSQALAQLAQDALREGVEPDNHRQIKRSQSVYLMEHVDCPAILVECGFLSNAREEQLLCSDAHQIKLTAAICGAVIRYISEEGSTNEV